jgi:secondary thiamine-phosphate synthase enzyme
LNQEFFDLNVFTDGIGLYDISNTIQEKVQNSSISNGLVNLFSVHTSCSLIIQENVSSCVKEDLLNFFNKIAPMDGGYSHDSEGIDDMPAHIKSCLTQTNLTISIKETQIVLGTWQGIFLFEHRTHAQKRTVKLHIFGE